MGIFGKPKEPKHVKEWDAHQAKEQTKAERFRQLMEQAKTDDERDILLRQYMRGEGPFKYEI